MSFVHEIKLFLMFSTPIVNACLQLFYYHMVTVPPKKYVCVSSLVYKWHMILEAFSYRRHGTIFCFLHSLLTGTGKDKLSPRENPYVSFH